MTQTAQTLFDPALVPYIQGEDLEFINALLEQDRAIWRPLPGPQQVAYDSPADVIGYGGAAGGGKTDLALGKILTQHKRSIVYRKNGTEHQAFIDRMEEILGNTNGFSSKTGVWKIMLPGAKTRIQMELGSVPNMGDERKYRGRPHDLKVFDEAAEIPESQIRFLLAWMRSVDKHQRCQALLCFNPPTNAEGRWILEFFAPWLDPGHPCPAMPGELRWFARIDGEEVEVVDGKSFKHNGELIKPLSRTFIPAKVTDNPYYNGGNYMATLQALPEPLRSQMLHGDFTAGMEDDPWQVIPSAWVELAMKRWKKPDRLGEMLGLGCDVARGGKDKTIIARRHKTPTTNYWFDEPLVYPGTMTPDGPKVMGLVVAAARDEAPQHVDIIGVGASPYDFLVKANQPVVGVDVRETSTATDISGRLGFFNLRSQLWWQMRELLDPANNTGVCLPPDKQLLSDLTAPTWTPEGKKIKVESREQIIDRIKRSPDHGSAYILGMIDTPKVRNIPGVRDGNKKPYDPYHNLNGRS